MTTATKLTMVEVRDRLQELLGAATEYAAAEAKMERLAEELLDHEDDWVQEIDRFSSAVFYEIKSALSWGERDESALDTCQGIQDALDVLKFAIEASDDAR
jgi:hypothetical protein